MKKALFTIVTILFIVLPQSASPAKKNTVVLFSRIWTLAAEREFVSRHILKPFEKENHCTVIFQLAENDDVLFEKIQAQQAADAVTTDVVIAYCALMQDWVEASYVEELTKYVKSWKDRTFPASLVGMTMVNGKQYFLPIGADVYLLIANKYALKYLPQGVDVQNIYWDQVVNWAMAIADGEGEGKFAITGAPQKMLIYQYGGIILSYGGGFPRMNSPGAINAWNLLVKMKHAYTPDVLTYETVIEPMKREKAWLTFAHCARVGEIYTSNPSQFIVAPAPKGPIGIGSVAGTSGLGLVKGAPHRALAIKLIEYFSRPEIQLKIAKGTGGFIPPVEEALELLGEDPEDEIIKKALYVMDKGILAFIPSTFGAKWGEVKLIYDNAFRKLVLKDKVVDCTYLDNAQEDIDALEVEGLLLKSTSTTHK